MPVTEITVPSSTSNLGASFDTCGLALSLYLRLTVEPRTSGVEITLSGEGAEFIPRDETNFIWQVANYVATERGTKLGGAKLHVESQIPLARVLGSSSSAIIAGLARSRSMVRRRDSIASMRRSSSSTESFESQFTATDYSQLRIGKIPQVFSSPRNDRPGGDRYAQLNKQADDERGQHERQRRDSKPAERRENWSNERSEHFSIP